MKKLVFFCLILAASYAILRSYLLAPDSAPAVSPVLRDLPREKKIEALDELKVLYEKRSNGRPEARPVLRETTAPASFYPGTKEDFHTMEKVQLLDERGNPVNIEDEEGNYEQTEHP